MSGAAWAGVAWLTIVVAVCVVLYVIYGIVKRGE